MNICLIVWSLCASKGGIERAGAGMANYFAARGNKVAIFYNRLGLTDPQPVYPVDPEVSLVEVDIQRDGSGLAAARESMLKTSPDVAVAFFSCSDFLFMPALFHNTGIPLIYTERNDPDIIADERWNRKERTACASASDAVVLFFSSFQKSLPDFLQGRVHVIPNAIKAPAELANTGTPANGRYTLLGVGRFAEEAKQFSLLMSAFAGLAEYFPDWDLRLCGDGMDFDNYLALADSLEINDRITFSGIVEDIHEAYAQSHLFCIPSRYEGFCHALVEAQRHGLPTVGFSHCPGVRNLIMDGHNGLLAPHMTSESLAEALFPLMRSAPLRQKMGANALTTSAQYDPDVVYAKWAALMADMARCKGNTQLNTYVEMNDQAQASAMLATILQRDHPFEELRRGM